MQAESVLPAHLSPEPSPGTVIARISARRAVRSGALWGYLFGILVASSALSYSTIYKTQAERDRLAASFGSNHAAGALFGPAPQLQTVAGFTMFKTSMTLMIIGAVWGLLTSTRLLRGEEDVGPLGAAAVRRDDTEAGPSSRRWSAWVPVWRRSWRSPR